LKLQAVLQMQQNGTMKLHPALKALIPKPISGIEMARRSSRPSSLLSSDSLLAVRLQQEELWKPSKAKRYMPAPMNSVFSAHAANGATHMPPASAGMPENNFLSSALLPLEHAVMPTKEPSYLQSKPCRKPSFRNVIKNSSEGLQLPFSDPLPEPPRKRLGKAFTDDGPASFTNPVKRFKAVYHER
jgi:hypothetical protein